MEIKVIEPWLEVKIIVLQLYGVRRNWIPLKYVSVIKPIPASLLKTVKPFNDEGFTLLETLLSFTMFCMLASFLPLFFSIMFDHSSIDARIQTMEWELFLSQIKKEIQSSNDMLVVNGQLVLMDGTDRVSFEKYNNQLRRQVNMKGHEIVLQNVASVRFVKGSGSLRIEVKDTFSRNHTANVYSFIKLGQSQ